MLPWGLPVTAAQRDKRPAGRIVRRSLLRRLRGHAFSRCRGKAFQRLPRRMTKLGWPSVCEVFWGMIRQQDAFFDVKVFYPFAPSYRNSRIHDQTVYQQHETQKRLHYGRRVLDVERGCFTPLVFTTRGGMAQEATVCLKRLASLLSERRNEPCCTVMGGLRCAISFYLLRSSLACIRGSLNRNLTETPNAHDICEAVTSSTHCNKLGMIHHFLYAQPTPVDNCHLTKFLMPFIYPILI